MKIRITAKKQVIHQDLIDEFENKIEHACSMPVGKSYVITSLDRPLGFCESAWNSIYPFVMTLYYGGGDFYDGWMKNKKSAMISCNDGFRPMSFYIEVIE